MCFEIKPVCPPWALNINLSVIKSLCLWLLWKSISRFFIADWHDDTGRAGFQCLGQEQEGLHHSKGADQAYQEVVKRWVDGTDGQGFCLFVVHIFYNNSQLDSDGDGQLSFDEFKVLFSNADKRRKDSQKEETLVNQQTSKVRQFLVRETKTII